MSISNFKLEEYFSYYEDIPIDYYLCCSDAQSMTMKQLLDMADYNDKKLWNELSLEYTEIKGKPLLREALCVSFYSNLNKESILCTAGADEALFCTLYALCQPQDHVIVFAPLYQSILETPRLKGAEVTVLWLKEENQWKPDFNEIISAIKENTRCIVINFPHNPTGQVLSQEEISDLVSLCSQKGIWIVSDEVYYGLGNPKDGFVKPIVSLYEKGISIGVLSKAFGLPGLRMGWIATQDSQIIKKIERVKHYTSVCNASPSEILALIALKNAEKILQHNNAIVSSNMKIFDDFLRSYQKHFSWIRPQAGCIGLIKLLNNQSAESFCAKLVNEKKVLLVPGSVYDLPDHYVRIGFGKSDFSRALLELEKFITEICNF